jgi:hypothetical protein
MVYGPFSLADAAAAELGFFCDYEIEPAGDTFFYGYSTDGRNFQGENVAGSSGGYVPTLLDLRPVCGAPQVWVAFLFVSDAVGTARGVWIDDLILRHREACGQLPAPGGTRGEGVFDSFASEAGTLLAGRAPDGAELGRGR